MARASMKFRIVQNKHLWKNSCSMRPGLPYGQGFHMARTSLVLFQINICGKYVVALLVCMWHEARAPTWPRLPCGQSFHVVGLQNAPFAIIIIIRYFLSLLF